MAHKETSQQTRHLPREVRVIEGDLLDKEILISAIERAEPDEVYNLAATTHLPQPPQHMEIASRVTGMGVLHVLEAIRLYSGVTPSRSPRRGQIKFFQASCSEIFGSGAESPLNENAPLNPRTPYGSAKAYAHLTTQSYRHNFGMFTVSGIMFNHESPRRSAEFVSRQVSLGAAKVKLGHERQIRLESLSDRREWGFAGDYVKAMPLMLAQDNSDDYVIGTGVTYSVEELVSRAFAVVGLNWRDHVAHDDLAHSYEAQDLCADPHKARKLLGWTPSVTFDELVSMMVESDLKLLSEG